MTAEEMRELSDKTVSELVEIICQLAQTVERLQMERDTVEAVYRR